MYCANCNCEVVEKITERPETYQVKGKEYTVNAQVPVCPHCNIDLWDPDAEDRILRQVYAMYREDTGLLSPEEIKEIREQYGLSQSSFARLLGFGEKTITRYENGALQDEVQNNLLLMMKKQANFQEIFEKNKGRLTEFERSRVKKKLRSRWGFWYAFRNDYHFEATNQWELQEEFAGN
ncbi:MAG: type II toxin-antitoxin system MqsA family antitoxin [Clostridia bacterium]|nr:type II toxin-antitoxin system MqsA family antitoxin [Clostridia bacterium]